MLSKLPKYVKIELHRKNGSQMWSLPHLREWLKDEIRAREMGERVFGERRPSPKEVVKESKSDSNGKFWSHKPQRFHNKKPPSTSSALVSNATNREIKCSFCGLDHYSDKCEKYPDIPTRRSQILDRGYGCLGKGHQAKECKRQTPCVYCKRKGHHRSLCFGKFGRPESLSTKAPPERGINVEAKSFSPSSDTVAVSYECKRTIMQTALATLVNEGSRKAISGRLLFDTAGSRTFITESICRELNLPVVGEELVSIAGFQSTKRRTSKHNVVQFSVRCCDGSFQQVTASVVPTITCPIQKIPIDPGKYPMLQHVSLAEPVVQQPEFVPIDVLIGIDHYYDFILTDRIQCPNGPLLLSSRLGYVTTGRVATALTGPETIAVMLLNSNPRDLSLANPGFAIERYWDLEDIGMKEPPNQLSGDDEALKFHSSTLERAEDGRYQSRWPWKQGHPDLPDNFALARGRLKSLMKRLDQNPELLGAYQKIIKDQLEKGIIEVAPAEPTSASVYYMPHHCVVTPTKTTTKLRIVYDASSKSRSDIPSLNDCLHRGPVLLEDLCGLIMRFRLHRIGLVSDIEKAFLQIGLQEEDRDVTRFLWIKNGSQPLAGSNLEIYRFCRVPFGVISSPFDLENTMCQHLTRSGTALARKILKDHYVDNVITGENDVDSAVVHYHESKQIFKSACMNLREWYSNSVEVRALFSDADRGIEQEPKILGLRWNFAKDVLRCDSLKKSPSVSTKRTILQSVSLVFDPLGFYSPIAVAGKILIQELWKCGYQWDQPLPGYVVDRWNKVQENLELISVSEIPRFIGGPEGKEIQLHVFCDASVKACAAVVFLKSESSCNLVMAKTRLAPTKINQTIPRLELIAVVIGVRLVTFVKEQIHVRVAETFLWTDSQCTLHWILKERVSSRFIKNRVDEIRKHSGIQFRYVPSEDNPADLPSRGCDVKTLRESSKWWHGPKWLAEYQKQWPVLTQRLVKAQMLKPWLPRRTSSLATL